MSLFTEYLPALLAFVAVALTTFSVMLLFEAWRAGRRRTEVMRRLDPAEAVGGSAELLRPSRAPGRLTTTFAAVPHLRDAELRLRQAGVGWSVESYVLLTVGAAAALGIAAQMITNSFAAAVVVAGLGALLPDMYVARRKRKRLRAFEEQFPEAIDLLGRAIRAGHPLSAGIRMVAEEAPEPIATEFRQVFEEQRFGLPFEDALLGLSDRNDLMDARIFVTAVLIQREVGGNLAEVLDKIAQTVRARFAILRQLRVYTAQGRLSGYVLAAMPVVMAIALYLLNKPYVMLLTEGIGRILVIVALVLQIIGYLWIRRIVDIEI